PAMMPLVHELQLTPWQAFQAAADLPCVLFFDSALPDPDLGRYSYVLADPWKVLRCRLADHPSEADVAAASRRTFDALAESLEPLRMEALPDLPPFQGGAAGLFGYGLCHAVERLPRFRHDEFEVPDFVVGLYDWVYAYDHAAECGWVISTGFPAADTARRRRAELRLRQALAWLQRPPTSPNFQRLRATADIVPQFSTSLGEGITSNFSREAFLRAIARGIEYVHAGDCFQVNLAQRLLAPLRDSPLELYNRLRQRNPAPFAAYFDLGDFVVASASPERFLRLMPDGLIETRPIKGTRPRGLTPEQDRLLAAELAASAKDRAENVMIVDLLRNDLGRVCTYGTIQVPQLCQVESYRTVHHLVSVVTGKLRGEAHAVSLLKAAFPGGSVTGAPKVRAMEIIAELEPTARGPYCGCLGWIGFDGAMDTNILIRTFTLSRNWIQFPVGGGIVADSKPEAEYEETLHKAAGLVRALLP
ncbi:MAG: aminodeoxychorismate synthase component I, partial [Gemmatales bacterium]|nr:aminodeoxychorismate synthase component I [Gemmatales bacterium]MDW8386397.1 aminodeoxychorismate synthase component I [Gemmatales bacterium]